MWVRAKNGWWLYDILTPAGKGMGNDGEGKPPQGEGLWEVHLVTHFVQMENGPKLEHLWTYGQ